MNNVIDAALLAQMGAQNPQALATYAAANGIKPPPATGAPQDLGTMAGGESLGELLEPKPQSPLAGVKPPPALPPPPMPATPAAPQPNGQIQPAASLLEMLLKGNQRGAAPSLAQYLGR